MAFHNVQFDPTTARGAVGGPSFATVVVETQSGAEQRIGQWSRPRMRWEVAHIMKSLTEAQALRDFFVARQGKLHTFRFKDWLDYSAPASSPLVLVSGSTYQLYKQYTSGGITVQRKITKPVSGTVSFSGGGTLDYATGLITGGSGGTWSGQFDVHARFDVDQMRLQLTEIGIEHWEGIPIVEVIE